MQPRSFLRRETSLSRILYREAGSKRHLTGFVSKTTHDDTSRQVRGRGHTCACVYACLDRQIGSKINRVYQQCRGSWQLILFRPAAIQANDYSGQRLFRPAAIQASGYSGQRLSRLAATILSACASAPYQRPVARPTALGYFIHSAHVAPRGRPVRRRWRSRARRLSPGA